MSVFTDSGTRRMMAALGLLIHLLLVGAGPALDARAEVAGLASPDVSHVHGEEAGACGEVHHHELCLIQALGALDITQPVTHVRTGASATGADLRSDAALFADQPQTSSLGARAPPSA